MPDEDAVTMSHLKLAGAALALVFSGVFGYFEVQDAKHREAQKNAYNAVIEQIALDKVELDKLFDFATAKLVEQRERCQAQNDLRDQRLFKALGFEDVQ